VDHDVEGLVSQGGHRWVDREQASVRVGERMRDGGWWPSFGWWAKRADGQKMKKKDEDVLQSQDRK
jgi:hypothetical protein